METKRSVLQMGILHDIFKWVIHVGTKLFEISFLWSTSLILISADCFVSFSQPNYLQILGLI